MSRRSPISDIFLSASPSDCFAAECLRRGLEQVGLKVFMAYPIVGPFGREIESTYREALIESRVFLAILSPSNLSSQWFAFFYGGARGNDKPIYLLLNDLSIADLPSHWKRHEVRLLGGSPQLVREIEAAAAPPSAERVCLLMSVYKEMGVPASRLLDDVDAMDDFEGRFREAGGADGPPDHLRVDLFRLRKLGKLPRLSPRTASLIQP